MQIHGLSQNHRPEDRRENFSLKLNKPFNVDMDLYFQVYKTVIHNLIQTKTLCSGVKP